MNASIQQKIKSNRARVWRFRTLGAEEGGGQNGGDFCSSGDGVKCI